MLLDGGRTLITSKMRTILWFSLNDQRKSVFGSASVRWIKYLVAWLERIGRHDPETWNIIEPHEFSTVGWESKGKVAISHQSNRRRCAWASDIRGDGHLIQSFKTCDSSVSNTSIRVNKSVSKMRRVHLSGPITQTADRNIREPHSLPW